MYATWDCDTPQYPVNCPVVSNRPMTKCVRWNCPTIDVDPLRPIDPIQPMQDHHGLYVGLGVAAAAIIVFIICGILVTIQN